MKIFTILYSNLIINERIVSCFNFLVQILFSSNSCSHKLRQLPGKNDKNRSMFARCLSSTVMQSEVSRFSATGIAFTLNNFSIEPSLRFPLQVKTAPIYGGSSLAKRVPCRSKSAYVCCSRSITNPPFVNPWYFSSKS